MSLLLPPTINYKGPKDQYDMYVRRGLSMLEIARWYHNQDINYRVFEQKFHDGAEIRVQTFDGFIHQDIINIKAPGGKKLEDLERVTENIVLWIGLIKPPITSAFDPEEFNQGQVWYMSFDSRGTYTNPSWDINKTPYDINYKENDYELKELKKIASLYSGEGYFNVDWQSENTIEYYDTQDSALVWPVPGTVYTDFNINGGIAKWGFKGDVDGYALTSQPTIEFDVGQEWKINTPLYLYRSDGSIIKELTNPSYVTGWASHYFYARYTIAYTSYWFMMANVYPEVAIHTAHRYDLGEAIRYLTYYAIVYGQDGYDNYDTYSLIYAKEHYTFDHTGTWEQDATDASGESGIVVINTLAYQEPDFWACDYYIQVDNPTDGVYEFYLASFPDAFTEDGPMPALTAMSMYIYDVSGHPLYTYCVYNNQTETFTYGYIFKGEHKQSEAFPNVLPPEPWDAEDKYHTFYDITNTKGMYGYGLLRAAIEKSKGQKTEEVV